MASADNNTDLGNHAILNLTADEKRAFGFLFNQADSDQLGVVTGERAVDFFERTHVSPNVLGEIWQIADTENRGLLTKPGFCMVLRLIGHYQTGRVPTQELAFKPAPIPRFDGLQIPGISAAGTPTVPSPTMGGFAQNVLQPQLSGQPIRVPPLDPLKAQQYSGLFERSGAQNGLLDGVTAKSIFERAGLPNEVLGKIWNLSDREQRGALNQTEFIIAMHLLTSMKTRIMTALPNPLPQGLYEAAARRGAPPPRQAGPSAAIPRQFSGASASATPRTQSPLAHAPGQATPPLQSTQSTGLPWLVTPPEKAKYDQFFASIDTQGLGVLTGEQAVQFFSDSRLPEETLATIWDLADINSAGQLTKDEFAVAMYLIRQQRLPNAQPLPAFLPPALIPPSLRQQTQQTQSTAPAFDNANNSSNLPKSAADDLFGLDEPTQSQAPVLPPQPTGIQTQGTGASARDPFGGSTSGSPTSPQRFQSSSQPASTIFKPFIPTSAFGTGLAQQHTGGSARGFPQQAPQPSHLQHSSAADDLLGDNDTHAEESSRLTNETTELANMSNQIGNLRSQMEQTQTKKASTQQDLNATTTQKRDLELRLQQFRSQYEQEVRTVKDLEQQLATSRESMKKLSQELAMLEGTYQDLQSQHNTVAQALQADQQENTNLKQKISQVNAEVAKLKPEIEKIKLDARQQKGLVSINKKQLTTNEGERDRLQDEKGDLEREAAEREEQARDASQKPQHSYGGDAAITAGAAGAAGAGAAAFGAHEATSGPTSTVVSPAASTMSSTNPFFRKGSSNALTERAVSPPTGGPNPGAFDAIFGPSATFSPSGQVGNHMATPPATSFVGNRTTTPPAASLVGRSIPPTAHGMTDSIQSVSSAGESTPAATPPPLSEQAKDSPFSPAVVPPPAQSQFTAGQLPLSGLPRHTESSETSSTAVVPPASRAGGVETPYDFQQSRVASPAPGSFNQAQAKVKDNVPGAFPSDDHTPGPSTAANHDDFDSAFAKFGDGEKAAEPADHAEDPFAASSNHPAQKAGGFSSEFPPIESLDSEGEDDSDDEPGFEDDFAAPATASREITEPEAFEQPSITELPPITSQSSPPTYKQSNEHAFGGTGERTDPNQFPPEFGGLLPSREDPTTTSPPAVEEPSITTSAVDIKENTSPVPQTARSTSVSNATPSVKTPADSDTFHDATSRPISRVTEAVTSTAPAKNAFDDFDDFDGLSEAKEADKVSSDIDFGFPSQLQDDFNPAFDSPAASTTVTSAQQTPAAPGSRSLNTSMSETNGFANFQPSASTSSAFASGSGTGSIQQTPQNVQHDWDAIFSGLDSSKAVDTALPDSSDPWGAPATTNRAADKTPTATSPVSTINTKGALLASAVTPGTEHDDPILKRLTGMGYPRVDALNALEKFDYDINKAVDHLTS